MSDQLRNMTFTTLRQVKARHHLLHMLEALKLYRPYYESTIDIVQT